MAIDSTLSSALTYTRESFHSSQSESLQDLRDAIARTWHLGFTAFGGPPVHFQIYHRIFVDGHGKSPWIDETTYQELLALCQALPGPASTKMIFQITLLHAGFVASVLVFFIWRYGLQCSKKHPEHADAAT